MIDFFGLILYPYGLALAGAAVIALLLAAWSFRKAKLDVNILSWFAPLAVVLGFLGARLGFCLAPSVRVPGTVELTASASSWSSPAAAICSMARWWVVLQR